jgi:asparagine synthase (glutamine-hydrolysing)
MCGIAGIISKRQGEVSVSQLRKMTDALVHRGPDGEGFWINEGETVGFGHRRLSIIDIGETGAQPMHYHHRFSIIQNGELYNYIELKNILLKNGFYFETNSDTEVILAAYACYGKDCLQYFDGMFAFAIWDEQEQTLFCARDRFGEKPFFYTYDEKGFVFASEMKALWSIGVDKNMNHTMMLNYLTLGINSNPANPSKTFYEHINKLPPAHFLELKFSTNGSFQFSVQRYWKLDKDTKIIVTEEEAIEQVSTLLQTSVMRRLRSDVSLGTSLSGGLDSSSIVAIMQSMLSPADSHASFSAVFPGFEKDESKYIQQVVDQFQLKNYTVTPSANDFITDFEKLCYHQEAPFQSASIFAQYKVYELAKQNNVTVLLDGQGADETMAGYLSYYHWYWQELLVAGKWKTAEWERMKAEENGTKAGWTWRNYAAAYFPNLAAKRLERKAMTQQAGSNLTRQYIKHHQDAYDLQKPVIDKLNDILYYNTIQLGLEDLLKYADRNSMAHSREVRLPFLQHELVQYIFSLPSNFKIKDGFTKWILRKAMNQKLPDQIVWRKDKIGFEPPQKQWLKILRDNIMESRIKLVKENILRPEVLQNPIVANDAHNADNQDWRYLCAAQFL